MAKKLEVGKYLPTKYPGVQQYLSKNGIKSFHIRYKKYGKYVREKVGTVDEGITAVYCHKLRSKKLSEKRLGSEAPMVEKEEEKRKKNLTVNDAARSYLDSIKKKSDYTNNVGRYDNHLRDIFGQMLLTEVTQDDVEKFVNAKQKEVSFKTGRTYATKTINDMVDLLNTIYNHIKGKENIVISSPAMGKTKQNMNGLQRLAVDNARQRYLNLKEIELLYKTIDNREGHNFRAGLTEDVKIFTRLALSTGARMTSILNIRKQDINITNKSVTIKDFKNNSTYIGYLSDQCIEIMTERYDSLAPTHFIIGGNVKQKHRVGINKVLQPILNDLFNQGLDIDDAQNRVVIHTLRHTFGSQLAIQGTPIYTIMKLMNHKHIEMTLRYAKLSPKQGQDAVASLGF